MSVFLPSSTTFRLLIPEKNLESLICRVFVKGSLQIIYAATDGLEARTHHKDIAEATALHQGSIEDVGVWSGAQIVVDIIAGCRSWRAGGSWVLRVHWGVLAKANQETAYQRRHENHEQCTIFF